MPGSLTDRRPDPAPERLVAGLVPPPRFDGVRFGSYEPAHPTQAEARDRLQALAGRLSGPARRRGLLGARRRRPPPASVYLDGGFGVGKTHLLASLWHATSVQKVYASFAQLVHLVGALSMRNAAAALQDVRLVCIDEFELDDPANTRLIATLLRHLVEQGACVAATSNTLPGQQGEGRFDTRRFRREIETLASAFTTMTIDGEDYRHRGAMKPPPSWERDAVIAAAEQLGDAATLDDGRRLQAHLAALHPIRYRALVEGLAGVFVLDATPVHRMPDAVRTAWLVDALYDQEIVVGISGVEVAELFPEQFLRSGYRKLFLRATSRLGALMHEAAGVLR
jgi:cell division protein ZapE